MLQSRKAGKAFVQVYRLLCVFIHIKRRGTPQCAKGSILGAFGLDVDRAMIAAEDPVYRLWGFYVDNLA